MTRSSTGSGNPLAELDIVRELDARNLRCPLPLLRAKQALRDLAVGEALRVEATDSGSVRDFQSFAELSGHRLAYQSEEAGVYIHILVKS